MLSCCLGAALHAGPAFQFPTANHALLEPGGEPRFFVPTPGRTWTSGSFGCVRSEGWQFHEGIDIRCLQRDRRGEPTDPVLAAADGTVGYLNRKAGLSNYGQYVVLRHFIEHVDVYTIYAHLRQIEPTLRPGQRVRAGEQIGVMGRTANTRTPISKERAHLHFEITLLLNQRYADWFKRTFPGQRNDHGGWSGLNFLGLDPAAIFREQHRLGARFSLVQFIRQQAELCRVRVRQRQFPWVQRYPQLIERRPGLNWADVAGFDLVLNYVGVPFRLIPRTEAELKSRSRVQLLSVDAAEYRRHPCRKLVVRRGSRWQLTATGERLIDLLLY